MRNSPSCPVTKEWSAPCTTGPQYENDYSVKYIDSQENEEAGRRLRRLNAWYKNNRIIDKDAFVIAIGD